MTTQAPANPVREQELRDAQIAAGKDAPRVRSEVIENEIRSVSYFTAKEGLEGACAAEGIEGTVTNDALGRITFCVITLKNGWVAIGHSSCVHADNFNIETGKRIAYTNAFDSLWPLFGFNLNNELHKAKVAEAINTVGEACTTDCRPGE